MIDEKAPVAARAAQPIDSGFVEGSITRTLALYAAPLLATNLLNTAAGTWGAVWVSHVLGPNALTAIVNANLFINMIAAAVMGVGAAAGVAIGQSYGAKDLTATKRVAATALSAAVLISVIVALLGFVFAPAMMDAIQMPAPARASAITYMRITCLALPALFATMFLMMMMRGVGDARTPFLFNLVGMALGMALGPMLMVGAGPLPALGVAGVALGGLIANALALSALIAYLYRRSHLFALRGQDLRMLRPDPALLAMFLRRGAPIALEAFLVQGAYFVLLSMVNRYGPAMAAAYSGAAQVWMYVQMPSMAIAASMSAMAAINIGAGRWARVDAIAFRGCAISTGVTATAAAIVYALGDWPLRLFLPEGGQALAEARALNAIVLWGWVLLSITSGLTSIVRANAAMLAPTLIFAVTMWVLRVPFAVALEPVLHEDAIWWSFPVGTISSALLAYGYYRWGGWRANKPMLAQAGPARPRA
jgi:putative MATE family efflux protein